MTDTACKLIEDLLNREPIDEGIEFSEEDKKYLFGKGKDFEAEAEYYETYEDNPTQATLLYSIADKLYELDCD